MKFAGRDPNFRAQAKDAAIVQARGGVMEHCGRIDFAQETLRLNGTGRDDRVRMAGSIQVDMLVYFVGNNITGR